ncbi:MAG: hypothetical protein CVU87_06270 [Firmicutes bacterium HGW-Firmicutes-12]|jgi:hypothetical protein|nr:MAG: hypothetical protein CVU87_06270 [Firmicutes bacterium HGW-Firmicutes-12]
MANNKSRQTEEDIDGSITINTPAEMILSNDADTNCFDNKHPCKEECSFKAHQLLSVGGHVSTNIRPHCVAKVKCLDGGIGEPFLSGTPGPFTFKFFQNLCVEVDVSICTDTNCKIDHIKNLGIGTGPCPKC